jgi:uncharacterized membrane protein
MEKMVKKETTYWNPASSWIVIVFGLSGMIVGRMFIGGVIGAVIGGGMGGAIGALVEWLVIKLMSKLRKS